MEISAAGNLYANMLFIPKIKAEIAVSHVGSGGFSYLGVRSIVVKIQLLWVSISLRRNKITSLHNVDI